MRTRNRRQQNDKSKGEGGQEGGGLTNTHLLDEVERVVHENHPEYQQKKGEAVRHADALSGGSCLVVDRPVLLLHEKNITMLL